MDRSSRDLRLSDLADSAKPTPITHNIADATTKIISIVSI